jgi:hypothetical protein
MTPLIGWHLAKHGSIIYCRSETRLEYRRRCNSESLGDFRYDQIGHLLFELC